MIYARARLLLLLMLLADIVVVVVAANSFLSYFRSIFIAITRFIWKCIIIRLIEVHYNTALVVYDVLFSNIFFLLVPECVDEYLNEQSE